MIRHGRNALIFLNGVDISGDLNTVTPSMNMDLADVSVFGNVGHTSYPGLAKDSASIDGLYNSTSASVFNSMTQINPGYGMMIAFGSSSSVPAYSANEVQMRTDSIKSVVTDVNRVTATVDTSNYPFESGLLLSEGKQLVAAASTGTGNTVDFLMASGTTGGAVYLQVFSVVGGTLTVSLQTSSTGAWAGEQATTATFAAASTSGTQRIGLTSQISRYARAAWAGATSTSQFAESLARY
jgi:hypothetical protein